MIITIEGPRSVGKTTLLQSFLDSNKDERVVYYKFYFAKYIKDFGLEHQEMGPGMHYFSLGNILSIFELNQTLFRDKVILFDRCLLSAYVWAKLRKRLPADLLDLELSKILDSDLYAGCKTLYVDTDSGPMPRAKKDVFDNLIEHAEERSEFERVVASSLPQLNDATRQNQFVRHTNDFSEASKITFIETLRAMVASDSILSNK